MGGRDIPDVCQRCGLCETATRWRVPNVVDTRTDPRINKKHAPVLVVCGSPSDLVDRNGWSYSERWARFLKQGFLDDMEVSWVGTYAVRCFAGKEKKYNRIYDKEPTNHQIKHCSAYVRALIRKVKPSVIVLLGGVAVKSFFGTEDTPSISKLRLDIQQVDGIPVLVSYHPNNDFRVRPAKFNTRDLEPEYNRVFSLAERIAKGKFEQEKCEYAVFTCMKSAYDWVKSMRHRKHVFFDVEVAVQPKDPHRKTIWHPGAKLLSCALTYSEKTEDGWRYHTAVLAEAALSPLVLESAFVNRIAVAHNEKFDTNCLDIFLDYDIHKDTLRVDDTFLMKAMEDLGSIGNGLKALAQTYFACDDWSKEVWNDLKALQKARVAARKSINKERVAKGLRELTKEEVLPDFSDIDPEKLYRYNAHDTYYTARLYHEVLLAKKEANRCSPVAYGIVQRASKALRRMEKTGLYYDKRWLDALEKAAKKKLKLLKAVLSKQPEIQKVLNRDIPFNVKSPDFCRALVETTRVHVEELTDSGEISMKAQVLRRLAGIHPRIPKEEMTRENWIWTHVYRMRELRDLDSKFFKRIREYGGTSRDGRIHTTFKLAKAEVVERSSGADTTGGTKTGRIATAEPSISQFKKDKPFLHIFEARPPDDVLERLGIRYRAGDWEWWVYDYSQIEIVILAWLANCESLLAAVREGRSIHDATTKNVYAIDETHEKWEYFRDMAKRGNFGKVYGQSPFAFSRLHGVPIEEAKAFFDAFDIANPEIPRYYKTLEDQIKKGLPVVTPFGYIHYFRPHPDRQMMAKIRRQMNNFPVQSTAAVITLQKTCELYDWIDEKRLQDLIIPCNEVHDAVWLLKHRSVGKRSYPMVKRILEDKSTLPFELTVPLKVEAKKGVRMSDLEKM